MKEDNILKARLIDLAKKAYQQNIYTYSSFLNPTELCILDDIRDEIKYIDYEIFGGAEGNERRMVGFGSEAMFGYEGVWPISIICVAPILDKFAEELGHRDLLGALMNLGIDRSVLGDIIVKGKRAYIFVQDNMAPYIMEKLTKVRHTNVRCSLIDDGNAVDELKPAFEDIECIVASLRFDAVIAALTKKSRSDVIGLFQSQKVSLNGRICEKNSMVLKPEDVFSIRGYGKYIYVGEERETRKGRLYTKVKKYV